MKREPRATDFPEHSFIHKYMKYMEGLETSYVYDFWCAAWLISFAVGRDIVVDRPRIPIYMNMFLVLAAESAVTRKSTAVAEATKFAKALDGTEPQYEFVQSRMSRAKLETRLSDISIRTGKSWAAISISEMVNFFGKTNSSGLIGLLTDLYDCPADRIGGGTNANPTDTILRNVYVNLITASTPTWLMQEITPSVIEGGFTSRTMFVWSEEPKAQFAMPNEENAELATDFCSQLVRIRTHCKLLGGKIEINEKAKKYFESWYRSRHIFRDSFRSSFGGREDSHVLRLAAILAISEGVYQIQLSHCKLAVRLVTELRDRATKLFEGVGSRTALVIAIDRVRDALVAAGKDYVTGTDLSRKTQAFIRSDQLQAILSIMNELGMLQRFDIKPKRAGGRPTAVYRGTKSIIRKGAVDEVMRELP